jgi:hypothetical protein
MRDFFEKYPLLFSSYETVEFTVQNLQQHKAIKKAPTGKNYKPFSFLTISSVTPAI